MYGNFSMNLLEVIIKPAINYHIHLPAVGPTMMVQLLQSSIVRVFMLSNKKIAASEQSLTMKGCPLMLPGSRPHSPKCTCEHIERKRQVIDTTK